MLDLDARVSLTDISRKIGLSRDAIRKRIQKMVDADVILGFKPILNPPRMGYPLINYVCLSLRNLSPEIEDKFLAYLRNNKNVTYISSLVGEWDYIINIVARDPAHFNEILKALRQKFSDIIKDYEIFGILEEYKYEDVVGILD
jgi:Lrp/AsnC family leucine-responsive transcriptional regulator